MRGPTKKKKKKKKELQRKEHEKSCGGIHVYGTFASSLGATETQGAGGGWRTYGPLSPSTVFTSHEISASWKTCEERFGAMNHRGC